MCFKGKSEKTEMLICLNFIASRPSLIIGCECREIIPVITGVVLVMLGLLIEKPTHFDV